MAVVTWLLLSYLSGAATVLAVLAHERHRRTMTHVDADDGMPTIRLHPIERNRREVPAASTSVRRTRLPRRG